MSTPKDPEGLCPPDDIVLADGTAYARASVTEVERDWPTQFVSGTEFVSRPMWGKPPRAYELNASTLHQLIGQRLMELDRKVRNFNTKVVHATPEGAAAKVGHEAVEFVAEPSMKEARDLLITLLGWVGVSGHDVLQLIEQAIAKMEINEGRKWVQQPDGSWQHEEDGTS